MATQHNEKSSDEKSSIAVAFFLNLSFTLIEFVGGFLTNSVAILSNAIHDFGDSFSLALAWYFQKLSKKEHTKQYSYGYKRFSLLGAIINSVVLIVGSVYIIKEAVPRLISPQETSAEGMFFLAILGIIINGVAVIRTRGASSINERVISLHLLEDVLSWAAILIASAVIYFTGWTIVDPVLSILIACFVLFNVFTNIKFVLPIILQGTPAEVDQEYLIKKLKSAEHISDVHDLHIWSMDECHHVLTIHIILDKMLSMSQLARLKKQIRFMLEEEKIQHATIEFETIDEECNFEKRA